MFKREVGVAPTLLFPIKGQESSRRVQLVQFRPVNSEASPFTPPGLCLSLGGRFNLGKLGLAIGNQTMTRLSTPNAGSRAGVGYLLFSSPWGIVMDISGTTSLLGGVFLAAEVL